VPAPIAPSTAAVMPAAQDGDGVPMLTQSADAMAANSPDSWASCTIAGEAPTALRTFAAKSIETKFVMHCTSGDWVRTRSAISVTAALKAAVVEVVVGAVIVGSLTPVLTGSGSSGLISAPAGHPGLGCVVDRSTHGTVLTPGLFSATRWPRRDRPPQGVAAQG